MADFALNWDTWDAYVSGGKIAEVTDGVEEMKQRIAIALKTLLGEWFLDTSRGLPYLTEILKKNPKLNQITSRVRAYLMTIEGVTGVRSVKVDPPTSERDLNINVDCETVEGITGPFNVTVTG